MIGRPSLSSFLKIVENNLLKNCPISREDVLAAEDILGPNLLDRTEENSAEPVETTGVDNTTLEMDQQYGERTHEHKLRPRRSRD
jgi:hypothetical protein